MKDRKIVLFEWNEVPYRIIDHYCGAYPNSCIARLLKHSKQYETYAVDIDTGYLSPTKTWPTLHRGISSEKHGLTSFGQDTSDVDREFPPIWQIISSHGLKVGVFASLFSYPVPRELENYSFYMPDSFATESVTHPNYLSPFQHFNLSMSRASSRNVSTKIDLGATLSVLPTLPNVGLTGKTFVDLGKQLVSEKLNPNTKTRRRTMQTVLGFDVFLKQLKQYKPDFSTFFTNHVAATMHRYWAATFPNDYDTFELEEDWVKSFQNEITFAMQKSDELLAQLVSFVNQNPEYVLYITSSMGQAAFKAEHINSWLGIKDFSKLMERLGLRTQDYEQRPAMAPIFNVVIAEDKIQEFRERTADLTIDGKKVTKERGDGFFQFVFQNHHNYRGPAYAMLNGNAVPFEELGIGDLPHEDGVYLTADHVPDGVMLVYDPKTGVNSQQRTKISTLDIAPSILSNFSISIPSYMSSSAQLVA